MIVTKYCSPVACQAMAKGNFRFGTLSGFAGAEGDGGLFQDLREGKGALQVSDEDASYETFSLAGMHFANNHFEGNGVAIHLDLSTDANAFCSARGWYSEEVHSFIRDGAPGYQPNPEYTSYIEFDLQRLHGAIAYMAFGMWGRNQGVLCKPVQYGAREKLLTKQQLLSGVTEQMTQEQLIEICFTKPDHFVGEQEFRFLILHEGEVSRVDTTDLDARTKGQFTGAILSVNVIE